MTLVLDASVMVAALVGAGPAGEWAESLISSEPRLAAPHLMCVETANILRRAVLAGELTADIGALAHADLVALPVELFPYQPFALRVWELRGNVTAYDGWYVALAESLDAPLATLDTRLSSAAGPHCNFALPPAGTVGKKRPRGH